MAFEQIVPVTINQFRGINKAVEPTQVPLEMTDLALNVFGDGSFVAKRPGLRMAGNPFAGSGAKVVGGEIYDMILVQNATAGGATHAPGLLVLHRDTPPSFNPRASLWIAPSPQSLHNIGIVYVNPDARRLSHLEQADNTGVYVTNPPAGATWSRLAVTLGVSPFYTVQTYASPDPTNIYRNACWHKQHLFWGNYNALALPDQFIFSNFGAPATFTATDKASINPLGVLGRIRGVATSQEIMYWLKTDGIYALSGSTGETFRLERALWDTGSAGRRSFDRYGGAMVGFVADYNPAVVPGFPIDSEHMRVTDIIALSGLQAESIGEPIRSEFGNDPVLGPELRVKRWDSQRAMLFCPRVPFADPTRDTTIFYRDMQSGAYWPWQFRAEFFPGFGGAGGYVRPNCFEYALRTMFVGCGDGRIRKFDFASTRDEADPTGVETAVENLYDSFWTTPWVHLADPTRKFSIEWVKVYGVQPAGGDLSFGIAYDLDGFPGNLQAFPLGARGFAHLGTAGTVALTGANKGSGYRGKVLFRFPDNAVNGRITRVVLGLRAIGTLEN